METRAWTLFRYARLRVGAGGGVGGLSEYCGGPNRVDRVVRPKAPEESSARTLDCRRLDVYPRPVMIQRRKPGQVRDAILSFLRSRPSGATLAEIRTAARNILGAAVPDSSVRSYLRLNVGETVKRTGRGRYQVLNS